MNENGPTGRALSAGDTPTKFNLTRSQLLIWTGQKMSPDVPMYNMGWCFRLDTDVDPERFARAFAALVEITDAFRMTFDAEGGVPYGVLAPTAAGRHEMRSVTNSVHADVLEELTRRPFDLCRETFRSALLSVEGERWEWILIQHHLATDAASGAIVLERLSDLYLALAADPGYRPEPAPAFAEWAAAQTENIKHEDAAYWSAQLENMPLPAKPFLLAQTNPSTRTKLLDVPLGTARTKKLHALIETERFSALTPHQAQFNLLATAVFAWLGRVTGSETVVVGVTTHGRVTQSAREMAGQFVQALPLGVNLTPDMTLASLHGEVASKGIELLMHASPAASSAAGHAKFNVILNYLKVAFGQFANCPVKVEWLDNGYSEATHGLWINVLGFGGADDLTLRLRMNEGVFPADLHERASLQILRCLDALLDHPDMPVGRIALATEADKSMALVAADPWAGASEPVDLCDLFVAQSLAAPEAVAATDDTATLTRSELNKLSDSIALHLAQRKIGPGDRVGLYLTRGVHLVAALLGVLKCGAAFVPIDPQQPKGRLQAIVDNADLALILTEKRVAERAPAAWRTADIDAISVGSDASVITRPDPDADAYVMFTSGTTGTPKGVRVSRRSLARHADFAARAYSGTGPKVWALHSAIGFDLTLTSIVVPLATGGEIRAYRERLDETDLSVLDVFSDDAVDVVKLTPSHLSLVSREQMNVNRIRTLILGGETLTRQLAEAVQKKAGAGLEIFNSYGPAEVAVNCMVHRFDPAKDHGHSVPIGQPAGATAIYLLDGALNPVPDGVQGEIYVAGPDRLAKGYLHDDAETRDRFVANPFKPGTLMYRTGDLGHVDLDGVIHYHGRADDQIKLGSTRFELGEIRTAFLSYAKVADCAVLFGVAPDEDSKQKTVQCPFGQASETGSDNVPIAGAAAQPHPRDEDHQRKLSCYIVALDGFDASELRRQVATLLPRIMIPASFRLVDRIPMTPNGKTDKSALERMPSRLVSTGQEAMQKPENDTETRLLEIWQAVLGREDFGVTDNFFDIGGDSIHAISIASRSNRAGLAVTAHMVLDQQTVAAVAASLSQPVIASAGAPRRRAEIDQRSMDKLKSVFGTKRDG